MKKILLYTLFLSFVSVLQAQITPTSTATTTTTVGGITIIDIAEPDSNGLSNNIYSNFNISSNGIVLNNSASTSLSQITSGNIDGNSNITAGNEANIILNQVTSKNATSLAGMLEMVGTNAGVIIANPNGITCNGCGFINASRIDLIAGTRQSDGSFSELNATINVTGTGLNASESELNLVSKLHTIEAPIQAGTNLRILSGDGSYNPDNFIITSDTSGLNDYAVDISSGGELQAASIDVIVTKSGFRNSGGTIEAENNLNLTVISTVDEGQSGGFFISQGAMIKAKNLNATLGWFQSFSPSIIDVSNDFNLIIRKFINGELSGHFTNFATIINANNFNAVTEAGFMNYGPITVTNNFVIATEGDFSNYGMINVTNNFDLTYQNSFNNKTTINADKFFISTGNDLEYNINYRNSATIDVNSLDVKVGGDLIYNDSNNDFIWNANYSLLVEGNAFITANNFINDGAIDIVNNFNVTAGDFDNNATLNANILAISANSFTNDGAIDIVNNFNVTAGDFDNNATLNANILAISANSFTNDGAIDIANKLNVITEEFDNNATIDAHILDISSDSFLNENGNITVDTLNLSLVRDFDYSPDYINNGNINTNNLAISIGDNDFFNDANIELAGSFEIIAKNFTNETTVDVANNFNVTASGDFDNNAMISANALGISADSFLNEGGNIIVDTLNLSLARYFDYSSDYINNGNINTNNLAIIIRDNDFFNDVNIELAGNFGITAENFTNKATIDAASFAALIYGDFQNANDSVIRVLRTGLFVNNFDNFGDIDSADLFFADVSADFINSGRLNSSFFVVEADNFSNESSGEITSNTAAAITVNSFNNSSSIQTNRLVILTTENNFDNPNNGNFNNNGSINSQSLAVIAERDFKNHQEIIATNNTIIQANNFYNYELGMIQSNYLDISTDSFSNEGDIIVYIMKLISNSYDNTGDIKFQYLFK